jgi:hypothetical protein
MRRRRAWALAAATLLLPVASVTARAATAFYLGAWVVASVEPGMWANYYEADKLAELRKLVDAPIVLSPRSVDGPPQIACPQAENGLSGETAHDLFDGKLEHAWWWQTPTPDEADPSGQYFAPEVLAERLGFRGFSWKALTTGCRANGSDMQIYFSSANTAAFRFEDFVVMIKRK